MGEAIGRGDDADDTCEAESELRGDRQRQQVRIAVARGRLRRGGLDAAFLVWEEAQRAGIAGAPRRRQREYDLRACTHRLHLPSGKRLRQRRARCGDHLAETRVGLGGVRNRQREREIGTLGNAGLAADKPLRLRRQRRLAAGSEIGCRRQRDEMQRFVLVPVIDERADRQGTRRRPFDGARRDAGRQRPGKRRRQPRVTWVAPIGMPAVGDLEPQRHRGRLSGYERRPFGDQLGFDLVGFDRHGIRDPCQREQRGDDGQAGGTNRFHRLFSSCQKMM
jgi:hypothetical protein